MPINSNLKPRAGSGLSCLVQNSGGEWVGIDRIPFKPCCVERTQCLMTHLPWWCCLTRLSSSAYDYTTVQYGREMDPFYGGLLYWGYFTSDQWSRRTKPRRRKTISRPSLGSDSIGECPSIIAPLSIVLRVVGTCSRLKLLFGIICIQGEEMLLFQCYLFVRWIAYPIRNNFSIVEWINSWCTSFRGTWT